MRILAAVLVLLSAGSLAPAQSCAKTCAKQCQRICDTAASTAGQDTCGSIRVGSVEAVSAELREAFALAPFYEKLVSVEGLPIVSSKRPRDAALREAAYLVGIMLSRRPDVREAMIAQRVRVTIMAYDEYTTQVPEHSDLEPGDWWDRRARGLGSTPERPAVSGAEENLLGFEGDPYRTECILIHEFAHAMHQMGLNRADPTFDQRLRDAFAAAKEEGLWQDTYAGSNHLEYWAEGVQSWFDTNRENDDQHNHINTRAELREYDPRLAALIAEVHGDGDWRYLKPADRQAESVGSAHLRGYQAATAPRFEWPEHLKQIDIKKPPTSSEDSEA